jgi:hypothetical protein
MHRLPRIRTFPTLLALVPVALLAAASTLPAQPAAPASSTPAITAATASVQGRVQNAATGDYLERVRLRVLGTSLETFTDADGFYRLTNLPPGTHRIEIFYTSLPTQVATLTVRSSTTTPLDLTFPSASAPTSATSTGPVTLTEFVVATSREMSGAARAINEQRFAPNVRQVVSTDEFGDVAEGNVAEFVKFPQA